MTGFRILNNIKILLIFCMFVKNQLNLMKLKPVQTIHLLFCVSIFLFGSIVLFVNKSVLFFDASLTSTAPFNPIFPAVAILGIAIGAIMFKKKLANITPEQSLDSKLTHYQIAFLIRCAFFEAGALLNIVGCLKTHNLFFILFAAASFMALLLTRPTKNKVIAALQLQYPDTESL